MLKDLLGEDEKIARKVAAIERNIDRASRIARELLHFSREKETALEATDLNKVLASVKNLLKHQPLFSTLFSPTRKSAKAPVWVCRYVTISSGSMAVTSN